MRINKKVQYGLMLCFHLAQNGRTTGAEAATSLGVPRPFLDQIANTLRIKGVLVASRGPNGGYALSSTAVTVGDVFVALASKEALSYSEYRQYTRSTTQAASNVLDIAYQLRNNPVFSTFIVDYSNDYVQVGSEAVLYEA